MDKIVDHVVVFISVLKIWGLATILGEPLEANLQQ
jgi:hypothetical protein